MTLYFFINSSCILLRVSAAVSCDSYLTPWCFYIANTFIGSSWSIPHWMISCSHDLHINLPAPGAGHLLPSMSWVLTIVFMLLYGLVLYRHLARSGVCSCWCLLYVLLHIYIVSSQRCDIYSFPHIVSQVSQTYCQDVSHSWRSLKRLLVIIHIPSTVSVCSRTL